MDIFTKQVSNQEFAPHLYSAQYQHLSAILINILIFVFRKEKQPSFQTIPYEL